ILLVDYGSASQTILMAGVGAKRSCPGGQVPCLIAHAIRLSDAPRASRCARSVTLRGGHRRQHCRTIRYDASGPAIAGARGRFPDRLRPASTSSAAPHLWIGVVHPQDGTDARFTQPLAGEAALEY